MAIIRNSRDVGGGLPSRNVMGGLPLAFSVLGHIVLLAAVSLGGLGGETAQGKKVFHVTLSSGPAWASLSSGKNSALVRKAPKAKEPSPALRQPESRAPEYPEPETQPETRASQGTDTTITNTASAKSLKGVGGKPNRGRHGLGVAEVSASIKSIIQSSVSYPAIARRRGIEGAMVAAFSLDTAGMPHGVRIVKSSGSRLLDEEVLHVIKMASPYPAGDQEIESIEVPVTFNLIGQ